MNCCYILHIIEAGDSWKVLGLSLVGSRDPCEVHEETEGNDEKSVRYADGFPPLTRILELVLVFLAKNDHVPVIHMVMILELHVHVRNTAGMVTHLVDVLRWLGRGH